MTTLARPCFDLTKNISLNDLVVAKFWPNLSFCDSNMFTVDLADNSTGGSM